MVAKVAKAPYKAVVVVDMVVMVVVPVVAAVIIVTVPAAAAVMMGEMASLIVVVMAVAAVDIVLPIMEVAAAVRPEAAAREQAVFVFYSTLSTLNKGVITYENIPDCR